MLSLNRRFIRNLLIGFFTVLVIVFIFAIIALFQTLVTYPNDQELPSVTIQSCYDGDTCTTKRGETIRLACIDAPELRGARADPFRAKAAKDYLNDLVDNSTVTIRRIKEDSFGRTIAELSKGPINIQERLVEKGYAQIYEKHASQCAWSTNKI